MIDPLGETERDHVANALQMLMVRDTDAALQPDEIHALTRRLRMALRAIDARRAA